jgi:diguanylate cyclase (GGDEF)-like protein/PAS domain S-box-containing protein
MIWDTIKSGELFITVKVAVTNVLLISDDDDKPLRIDGALTYRSPSWFNVKRVRRLSDGLNYIAEVGVDAVLLDLSVPDSEGIGTFEELYKGAPQVPILILGGEEQEAAAAEAVRRGAQDYLLPNHLDRYLLPRALQSAIERKRVETALYIEKERALVTLNSIGNAVLCTDVSGNITYMNLVAETMTGWSHQEAVGQPLTAVLNIIDSLTRKKVKNPLEIAIPEDRSVGLDYTCLLIRRDGFEFAIGDSASPIHDRKGRIIGAVIVFHDVTVDRAISRQLIRAAQFDPLTDLPSRALFANRLSQAMSLARRQKACIAVLFLDLDHFKYINDSLGHAIGDLLLQSVAKRLCENLRESDTACRQGGDEFIILLAQIADSEGAAVAAKKIQISLNAPYLIGEHRLHLNVSIGSSVYPEDGEDGATLIQNADNAMYRAKEAGRNSYRAFEKE